MKNDRQCSVEQQQKSRRASIFLALLGTVSLTPAFLAPVATAQQRDGSRSTEEEGRAYHPEPAYGLTRDNLDQVAASAKQILEIVNKDAGMMVELKRLLAQDAAANGQLLEELDLTEAAITQRLEEDLHSRVMATRMLQHYGYLLPRINPGSDAAAEHDALVRGRAEQILRASQDGVAQRQTVQRATSTSEAGANAIAVPGQVKQEGEGDSGQQRRPATVAPPDFSPGAPYSPDYYSNSPKVLRTTEDGSTANNETVLASLATDDAANYAGNVTRSDRESNIGAQQDRSMGSPGDVSDWPVSDSDVNANANTSGAENSARLLQPSAVASRATQPPGGRPWNDPAWSEPVHMVRRSNPYAAAPSLYDLYVQASPAGQTPQKFGMAVFRNGNTLRGNLPMDLPVGPDYVLGPGDGLSIDVWGGVSQQLSRTVDREGRVLLPEVGPLLVSGKSLVDAQDAVQRALRTQFRDISADLSLRRLRSVRVYVVGEVAEPGAYDVSSLSTPLNALFAAGGATPGGSLRRLEHYRGKQLIEEVDAYDLLLHGVREEAQRLENGDSLRVPPAGPTVTVDGMVRRPGEYELRTETNLSEALDLAGGVLPAAALRHIEVQRLEAHQKRIMLSLEVDETSDKQAVRAALEKFQIRDGDQIHIFPIAPYNASAIYLEGHVLRPGRYSYREGMRLSDLFSSYKDLLPEPSTRYAEIIRIAEPDYRPVVVSFDLGQALEHPENSPKLQPLDTVRVFGRFDLEAAPEFSVLGEVRAPGRYRFSGQEHLRDAVFAAGGATPETLLDSAQLFRAMPDGSTKVLTVALREALAGDSLENIAILPRDRLLIHRQPEKISPPSVYVRGEVARPGRYPLADNMHVSDLVRAAGGFLRGANANGGDLTRYPLARGGSAAPARTEQAVNLSEALAGNQKKDFSLADGDVLTVPQQSGWKDVGATMTLRGEVAKPGVYGIQPGERLSSVLRRAGGLLPSAYPQAAVFEREDVMRLQQKNRDELIQRLEQESTTVRTSVNTTGTEEAALQEAALQQRQRVLDGLRKAPVTGRLVVHIREGKKDFARPSDDIEVRAGDSLEIPKQPGFELITGQVYNSNAITYTPGKNAAWYLSRAGGATGLANKRAIFIVRADGSVTSGNAGPWSGGVLSQSMGPGDTIVVPEKPVLGGSSWKNVLAIAQIAEAGALTAAFVP